MAEEVQPVECRKLKSSDLFTAVKLFKPHLNVQELANLFTKRPPVTGDAEIDKKNKDAFTYQIGLTIFDMLGDVLTDDNARAWLADLAQMSLQEFDDASLETPFLVIRQVAKENDLMDFFGKVFDMMNNFSGSGLTKFSKGITGQTT